MYGFTTFSKTVSSYILVFYGTYTEILYSLDTLHLISDCLSELEKIMCLICCMHRFYKKILYICKGRAALIVQRVTVSFKIVHEMCLNTETLLSMFDSSTCNITSILNYNDLEM